MSTKGVVERLSGKKVEVAPQVGDTLKDVLKKAGEYDPQNYHYSFNLKGKTAEFMDEKELDSTVPADEDFTLMLVPKVVGGLRLAA